MSRCRIVIDTGHLEQVKRPVIVVRATDFGGDVRPSIRIDPDELEPCRTLTHIEVVPDELVGRERSVVIVLAEEVDKIKRSFVHSLYLGPPLHDAVHLSGAMVPPVIDTTSPYLFRGDHRPPGEIFAHGFRCRGEHTDIGAHVESALGSRFVATSRNRAVAAGFGTHLYLVRNDFARGIDLNATFQHMGQGNPYGGEDEVAFYQEIPPQQVVLACQAGRVTENPGIRFIPPDAYERLGVAK